MAQYAKICTKNIKCCELYCMLTKHTIKLSRKNMQMHESSCSSHNTIVVLIIKLQ